MATTNEKGVNRSQAIRDYLAEHPDAGNKDVIQGLKENGLEVTETLVTKVKFRLKSRAKRKKIARHKTTSRAAARPTAAPRGALSDAIRGYLQTHRKAPPKEIVAALAGQGITVTPQLVNQVKVKFKKQLRRRNAIKAAGVAAPARASTSSKVGISANDLFAAKKLADQLGGVKNAQLALDLLTKLQ